MPRGADLLDDDAACLVNTVNCVGVMGAGLAKQCAQRMPAMLAAYKLDCRAGMVRTGTMHLWQQPDGPLVANFPAKRHWRDDSQLAWVEAGLDDLVAVANRLQLPGIAIPALGCGLGGLNRRLVQQLVRGKLGAGIDHPMTIHLYV